MIHVIVTGSPTAEFRLVFLIVWTQDLQDCYGRMKRMKKKNKKNHKKQKQNKTLTLSYRLKQEREMNKEHKKNGTCIESFKETVDSKT